MVLTVALDVTPLDGVRASHSAANGWDGVDGFGQFQVLGLERFAGTWIRFRATLCSDHMNSIWPKLTFDCGSGFSSFGGKVLPRCSRAAPEVDYVLFLPRGLRAVRLDLVSSGAHFFLSNVRATLLSKFSASIRMLAVVRAADGNIAGARHALRRLLTLVHRPSIFPLHDRYREIRLGRGYSYSDWIKEFEATPDSFEAIACSRSAWPFKPTISLLMPVYNTAERLLCKCIESVIAQRYPDWELCIADDASTAVHIRKQLDAYTRVDSRIKVFFRATTGGIAAATN